MQEAPSPIYATFLTLENLNRSWIYEAQAGKTKAGKHN
jgi:hypothetical protein